MTNRKVPVFHAKHLRSITEILKEADTADNLYAIERLGKEVELNKWKYSLIELQFIKEHLKNL